jgi:hypothetical protein
MSADQAPDAYELRKSGWNAQENAPMIAVNDLLGARVNGRLAIIQKVLSQEDSD